MNSSIDINLLSIDKRNNKLQLIFPKMRILNSGFFYFGTKPIESIILGNFKQKNKMALMLSNMMELGTKAPDFTLPDTVSGNPLTLSELDQKKATVIVFICNHCPFVHHINSTLVKMANFYQEKGVQFIAISSNNIETHPQDAPEFMTEVAKNEGYSFPYLYDESQDVAKAYKAECTPDFFVFDQNLNCVYRGRLDESTPGKGTPTGQDLGNALDNILEGNPVDKNQKPSMGCGIKWK